MKRGDTSASVAISRKLQRQIERIAMLPKPQQRFVMQMIDTVLQQQNG
jgi:hypothetical protein